MLLKLAFLNIWRRKSRTVIVIVMIGLSLAGLMFIQGLYDGWLVEMIEHTVRTDGGEIVIQHRDYRQSRLLADRLKDPDRMIARLVDHPKIKRAARRIIADSMAATGRKTQGAMLVGVQADEFSKGYLGGYLVEGRAFQPNRIPEAVLVAELADKLKTGLGKKLVITAQGLDRDLVSVAVRVVGIIRTYNMHLDKNAVFIDYEVADRILGMAGGVTQVTLELNDSEAMADTAAGLAEIVDEGHAALTWRQRYRALDYSVEAMALFNLIHYGIVFMVVAIGITDIIIISVLERVREFGIMMALGTKFAAIRWLIMLESAILGGLGLVLGVSLGLAILVYYHNVGLDLSAFSEGLRIYAMPPVMYADIRLEYLAYAVVSVTVASLVSALIPIRMLSKKRPVQSINMV